ncbi:MAG: hypothetical protein ACTSUE_20110 [Promethearchaeota archaeon]
MGRSKQSSNAKRRSQKYKCDKEKELREMDELDDIVEQQWLESLDQFVIDIVFDTAGRIARKIDILLDSRNQIENDFRYYIFYIMVRLKQFAFVRFVDAIFLSDYCDFMTREFLHYVLHERVYESTILKERCVSIVVNRILLIHNMYIPFLIDECREIDLMKYSMFSGIHDDDGEEFYLNTTQLRMFGAWRGHNIDFFSLYRYLNPFDERVRNLEESTEYDIRQQSIRMQQLHLKTIHKYNTRQQQHNQNKYYNTRR